MGAREGTFSASEVRDAVLAYHDGCTQGKVDFLSSMGIDVEHEESGSYRITITIECDVDAVKYNENQGNDVFDELNLDEIAEQFSVSDPYCDGIEYGGHADFAIERI